MLAWAIGVGSARDAWLWLAVIGASSFSLWDGNGAFSLCTTGKVLNERGALLHIGLLNGNCWPWHTGDPEHAAQEVVAQIKWLLQNGTTSNEIAILFFSMKYLPPLSFTC